MQVGCLHINFLRRLHQRLDRPKVLYMSREQKAVRHTASSFATAERRAGQNRGSAWHMTEAAGPGS